MSNEFWQTIGDFVAAEMRGAELERERIIKLLEGTDLLKTIEGGTFVNYADTAIELIKGEQK